MDKVLTEITSLEALDVSLAERDNSVNEMYISPIPQCCKDYPCLLGIDEAGRGPVLGKLNYLQNYSLNCCYFLNAGPMVYGISFCPINKAVLLDELECDDSKVLNEQKRDTIFEKICSSSKTVGWAVEVISPNVICNNMLSRAKVSLNQVSMNSAIGLIKLCIQKEVNIAHIYVDTVGSPEKYQAYLKSLFPQFKITVAKKADSTYPIVSAASICAKVTRDHALQVWKFPEGLDVDQKQFGSGYPGGIITILCILLINVILNVQLQIQLQKNF